MRAHNTPAHPPTHQPTPAHAHTRALKICPSPSPPLSKYLAAGNVLSQAECECVYVYVYVKVYVYVYVYAYVSVHVYV